MNLRAMWVTLLCVAYVVLATILVEGALYYIETQVFVMFN